jgi:hypothetical protein
MTHGPTGPTSRTGTDRSIDRYRSDQVVAVRARLHVHVHVPGRKSTCARFGQGRRWSSCVLETWLVLQVSSCDVSIKERKRGKSTYKHRMQCLSVRRHATCERVYSVVVSRPRSSPVLIGFDQNVK